MTAIEAALAKSAAKHKPGMPMSHSEAKGLIKDYVNQDWSRLWTMRRTSWAYNWLPHCSRKYKCPPMNNRCTNAFNSLICNTVPLRHKLCQWGIISTPDCIYHPGFRETCRHFLFDCSHHNEMRSNLKSLILTATGNGDFTFYNIMNIPECALAVAEVIVDHLDASKASNNRVLCSSQH